MHQISKTTDIRTGTLTSGGSRADPGWDQKGPGPPYVGKYFKFLGIFRKIWFRPPHPFGKLWAGPSLSRKSGSATVHVTFEL